MSAPYPRARKRFGQHFLEPAWVTRLVNLVDPAPYDRALAVRGVEATLTALSAHAEKSQAGRQSASPLSTD